MNNQKGKIFFYICMSLFIIFGFACASAGLICGFLQPMNIVVQEWCDRLFGFGVGSILITTLGLVIDIMRTFFFEKDKKNINEK